MKKTKKVRQLWTPVLANDSPMVSINPSSLATNNSSSPLQQTDQQYQIKVISTTPLYELPTHSKNHGNSNDNKENQQLRCGKTAKKMNNQVKRQSRRDEKKREQELFAQTKPLNQETLHLLGGPKLSSQILEYSCLVELTNIDNQRREVVRMKVEELVQKKWPEAKVFMFGSSASNLSAKDSDIDLTIACPGNDKEMVIKTIQSLLGECGISHTKEVLNARVPILKLLSTSTMFPYLFDISVNNPLGIHNSALILCYTQLDPRVRPLAFVLKKWIKDWQLYQPRGGGLTSYCLSLMLIFFLQTREQPILPNLQTLRDRPHNNKQVQGYNCWFQWPFSPHWRSKNKRSVGQLLGEFFHFWWNFDYERHAASVRLGKLIEKQQCQFDVSRPFCVEDPFELDFNCSRLVSKKTLTRMKKLFRSGWTLLTSTQNLDEVIRGPNQPQPSPSQQQYSLPSEILQQEEPSRPIILESTSGTSNLVEQREIDEKQKSTSTSTSTPTITSTINKNGMNVTPATTDYSSPTSTTTATPATNIKPVVGGLVKQETQLYSKPNTTTTTTTSTSTMAGTSRMQMEKDMERIKKEQRKEAEEKRAKKAQQKKKLPIELLIPREVAPQTTTGLLSSNYQIPHVVATTGYPSLEPYYISPQQQYIPEYNPPTQQIPFQQYFPQTNVLYYPYPLQYIPVYYYPQQIPFQQYHQQY